MIQLFSKVFTRSARILYFFVVQRVIFMFFISIIFSPVYPTYAHDLEQNIIKNARDATVGILKSASQTNIQSQFDFIGTGVHVGNGYMVTARHVVSFNNGASVLQKISILTSNFYELTADLVGENESTDIAVYRLPIDYRAHLTTGVAFGTREPVSGDDVFTIGNSLGGWLIKKFGHTGNTNIYFSASKTRLMQLDIPVCSGDSGSGAFNERGELVGMVGAIVPTESFLGGKVCSRFTFAIPLKLVQRVVTQLLNNERPSFSFIGVDLEAVQLNHRWMISVKAAHEPAFKGGMRSGDIIFSVNGYEISDAAQLKSFIVEETRPGDTLSILVLRAGEKLLLRVTTGGT